jgi:hypothetical protein
MTYARSILAPSGSPGTYHCVSRCVRRAWLCGEDRESGRSYEHRRQRVEARIGELAEIFSVAIWGYAVMSNHLHVVVEVVPQAADCRRGCCPLVTLVLATGRRRQQARRGAGGKR